VKRRYAEEVLKCFRERNHRPEGMLCNVLFKLASSIRKLIVNLIVARQNEMLSVQSKDYGWLVPN